MDERARFFYDHAGWSHGPDESSEDGRVRCATQLAIAEEIMEQRGWWYSVEDDWDASADPDDNGETTRKIEAGELQRLNVWLADDSGRCMAQMGSVIVANETDPYVRVVAAELAAELLATHQECGARTTCGGCGNAWCERCDPAPSWACHWCHGRGHSTAPMDAPTMEEVIA